MIPQQNFFPPRHLITVFCHNSIFFCGIKLHPFFCTESSVLTGGSWQTLWTYLQGWVQSSYFHNSPWWILASDFFLYIITRPLENNDSQIKKTTPLQNHWFPGSDCHRLIFVWLSCFCQCTQQQISSESVLLGIASPSWFAELFPFSNYFDVLKQARLTVLYFWVGDSWGVLTQVCVVALFCPFLSSETTFWK